MIQGVDGLGYVTGEVSAADAAAHRRHTRRGGPQAWAQRISRTEQQRRSDLFADLLLGRLASTSLSRTRSKPTMRTGWKSKTLTPTPVNC